MIVKARVATMRVIAARTASILPCVASVALSLNLVNLMHLRFELIRVAGSVSRRRVVRGASTIGLGFAGGRAVVLATLCGGFPAARVARGLALSFGRL